MTTITKSYRIAAAAIVICFASAVDAREPLKRNAGTSTRHEVIPSLEPTTAHRQEIFPTDIYRYRNPRLIPQEVRDRSESSPETTGSSTPDEQELTDDEAR